MWNKDNIKGVVFSIGNIVFTIHEVNKNGVVISKEGKAPFHDVLEGTITNLNNGSYKIVNQSYEIY